MRIASTHNRREYNAKLAIRCCFCKFCPFHDIENVRGSYSRWGKKRAMQHYYRTGRGRRKPKRFYKHTFYQNNGYPESEGGRMPAHH